MAHSSDHYLAQLQDQLPTGIAWTRDPNSPLTKLLLALGDGFARFEARAEQLLDEADPRTTAELLPDWESSMGLPDLCCGPAPDIDQRRAQVIARDIDEGGQSVSYFIQRAATLGFTITITEFAAWRCDMPCDLPINGTEWNFTWRVNAPATTIVEFTCMSPCDEPLRAWGNLVLECDIRRHAPAHTNVLFGYV